MNQKRTFALILPAVGAAILAALSPLVIAIGPVPITLQTFAIGLVATIFRTREAFLAALLYLLLGAIGLPVFAGGSGGFQALQGPSAGFLWAYPLFAALTAYLTKPDSSYIRIFLANVLGDTLVFIGGLLGLMLLAGYSLDKAFAVGVAPFILVDLAKLLVVTIISRPLFKSLKFHPYFSEK